MIKLERHQLAQNYGKMLALQNEALREGLDKKPEMQALLRYVRASALGGSAYKQVVRGAGDNSSEALEKFYKANQASYDRYTLRRLFIPMNKQRGQAKSLESVSAEDDQGASAPEMKALAEKMRARAAAGEAFTGLQKEIFQESGIQGDPNVEVADVLRGTLSAEQNQVFDLAPGTVSSVIADATGYFIYKVVSKRTPAFDTVRDQVAIEMANRRSAAELKKIEAVKVNENYFEKYDAPAPNPNEPEVDDD
jgi:parvulin-like peptidyl-prolyl isomerase